MDVARKQEEVGLEYSRISSEEQLKADDEINKYILADQDLVLKLLGSEQADEGAELETEDLTYVVHSADSVELTLLTWLVNGLLLRSVWMTLAVRQVHNVKACLLLLLTPIPLVPHLAKTLSSSKDRHRLVLLGDLLELLCLAQQLIISLHLKLNASAT